MGWLDSTKATEIKNPWLKSTVKAEKESVYAPYIPQAMEEEEKKRKKTGVLQWVFDRLSTGQYVVANLVDEIITSAEDGDPAAKDVIDVLKAMGEGVTGARKGDWAEILKRRLEPSEFTQKPIMQSESALQQNVDKLFPGLKERRDKRTERGGFMTKATASDVVGFLANIFLDPMTYINPLAVFSPAKGAVQGAKVVAEDTAKIVAKALTGSADDITRTAIKGVANMADDVLDVTFKGIDKAKLLSMTDDIAKATKPAKKTKLIRNAQEYLMQFAGKDVARLQARTFKNTYRKALYQTPETLQQQMFSRLGIDQAGDVSKQIAGLSDELRPIGETALRGYPAGSGTTKIGDFFGIELGVKHRPGQMMLTDRVRNLFQQKLGGSKLADATWTIMNRGAIGEIRKKIGIYNPYQKYLNEIKLDEKRTAEFVSNDIMRRYVIGKPNSDTANKAAQWLITKAEEIGDKAGMGKSLNGQELVQMAARLNPPPEIANAILKETDDVIKAADNFRGVLNELHSKEIRWNALKFGDEEFRANYFPKGFRKKAGEGGVTAAGFTKQRAYTWNESREGAANMVKLVTGLDDEAALKLVDSGVTDYITDIDELMASRIMAHAKMDSKVNMFQKFRELGVDMKNFDADTVSRVGNKIDALGLRQVNHPALEGYLFDKDVADILDRAVQASGKEMGNLQRVFTNYTQWWRALVTTTTGFHMRNAISNNFTGFMKHGAKWLDPNNDVLATVGVLYATAKNNPEKWKSLGAGLDISEDLYRKTLNRVVGEGKSAKTLRELVDDALQRGVISQNTQGFDASSLADKIRMGDKFGATNLNPLPQGIINKSNSPNAFIPFKASRAAGNVIENSPRFKSFIIDYTDLSKLDNARIDTLIKDGIISGDKASIDQITKYASDYASLEAKKWFIDYEDLTQFEQKVLKNIIPFYTWLRKNIANQLSGITMYPGIYALVPKAEELLSYQDPEYDPSLVPDYMRQLGYFPIGKTDKKVFTLLNPNLPFQDLARIPLSWEEGKILPTWNWKEVKDDIVGASHPLIKTIVEMIPEKGYDTWRKKDIEPTAEAPRILRMFTKTPRLLNLFDGILRYAGFSEGLNPKINQEGKLELNGKLLKVIENNLPLVKTVDQLYQSGSVLFGQDEAIKKSYEEMAQEKTPLDALNKLFNVVSYWGGIKQRGLDLGKEEDWMNRSIYKRAQEIYADRDLTDAEVKEKLVRLKKTKEREASVVRKFK